MKRVFCKLVVIAMLSICTATIQAQENKQVETTTANVPLLQLNNGAKMPQFGLGLFMIPDGDVTYNSVLTALRNGYRHFDSAHAYRNERGVGKAIHTPSAPIGRKS